MLTNASSFLPQTAEEVTSFCRQHDFLREMEKQTDLSDAEKLRRIVLELVQTEKNYLKVGIFVWKLLFKFFFSRREKKNCFYEQNVYRELSPFRRSSSRGKRTSALCGMFPKENNFSPSCICWGGGSTSKKTKIWPDIKWRFFVGILLVLIWLKFLLVSNRWFFASSPGVWVSY